MNKELDIFTLNNYIFNLKSVIQVACLYFTIFDHFDFF